MRLHDFIDRAYETLLTYSPDARMILLHPRSRYRSLLVAHLANTPGLNVFYYALGPDDVNLHSFLNGITHDLGAQHPTFGRHLHMLAPDECHFDKLLTTFAQDICEISADPFMIILDEYDRADGADDIQNFIEKLVGYLPDNCRIIINSRTLPRLSWISMTAKRRAVLLEDDLLLSDNFYNNQGTGNQTLEVFALGPGFVLLNDKMIDAWEGHLPRLLFFFALERPVITRSEICEAFWPELDTDQAVNVFHVTKRRLHKALDMDVLVHEDGYYRINPDLDVYYDSMAFVTQLIQGRNRKSDNWIAAYQQAVDLYRGPFLQGHTDPWISMRRADYRAGFLEALTEIANFRLQQDRPELALGLFQRAVAEDNTRQDLHREIMQLFARLGRRSEAAAHYQWLCDDAAKSGWTLSPETQKVYGEIMS
jgi:DNA-binding SARP family transcriptional activator